MRKSGLTFAPEAGTQRMRDVINKNVTEEELKRTVQIAFNNGWSKVKLYFMIGLPTETDEDVVGIPGLGQKVIDWYYETENRQKGRKVAVTVSARHSCQSRYTVPVVRAGYHRNAREKAEAPARVHILP